MFVTVSACCSPINTISSGYVNFSTNGVFTIAIFSCSNTYNLIGADTLTCRSDGNWNLDQPQCSKHFFLKRTCMLNTLNDVNYAKA